MSPIYEFKCTECHETFEEIIFNNVKLEIKCPLCKSKTKKTISKNTNFKLKGQGWYETDYKEKK